MRIYVSIVVILNTHLVCRSSWGKSLAECEVLLAVIRSNPNNYCDSSHTEKKTKKQKGPQDKGPLS